VTDELQQSLELLVRGLVDHPDDVVVTVSETDHVASAEVSVHDADFGKVLGRKGAYAQSIRRVYGAAYRKHHKSFNLHIVDPRRDPTRQV
jgi:uncharacterized protein